jgi:hypothetical protein
MTRKKICNPRWKLLRTQLGMMFMIMINFMLEKPNHLRFKMGSVWKCARCVAVSCCDGQSMSRSRGVVGDRSVGLRRTYAEFSFSLGSSRQLPADSFPLLHFTAHLFHGPSLPRSYITALCRRVFVRPHPPGYSLFLSLPLQFSPPIIRVGYARMAASPAPSNQKPIICLRVSLRRSMQF